MNNFSLNQYQAEAMSFRLPSADNLYTLLNLAGEVGELLGLIAKARRDGAKFDLHQNAKKELGDVLWHVAAVAADYGFTLEDVAMHNIYKLSDRKNRNVIQGSGDER